MTDYNAIIKLPSLLQNKMSKYIHRIKQYTKTYACIALKSELLVYFSKTCPTAMAFVVFLQMYNTISTSGIDSTLETFAKVCLLL